MRYEGDNMTGLRRGNRAAVLRCLQEQGDLSRKRLAELLGLTPAAMTKIVSELIGEGLVREGASLTGDGAGRREILLKLESRSRCALGVLLGLGGAVLSAVWLDGEEVFSETIPLPQRAPTEETVKRLARRLMALAVSHGLRREVLLGVGIAVRGVVAEDDRSISTSFDALDTSGFPVCARFEAYTGLPAVLSNNVRALLAAQLYLTRPREDGSCFFVRCQSGIGAAFSLGGRVWAGDRRRCAEIGHIPAVSRGGKPCHCGKRGCLETVASPAAILEDALALCSEYKMPVLWQAIREKGRDAVTVFDVLDAVEGGDPGAAAVVDRAAKALASSLKSAVCLLDPGKILLYGGIFDHPAFLSRLTSEIRAWEDRSVPVPVVRSEMNGTLEHKAACLLMAEHFLENGGMIL